MPFIQGVDEIIYIGNFFLFLPLSGFHDDAINTHGPKRFKLSLLYLILL